MSSVTQNRLPDEALTPCLEVLDKQFIKALNPIEALQTLQSKLFTGEEAIIRRPSDVHKGAALKLIADAQVDRVLLSHTFARLRSILEEYDKKVKADKRKTLRKVKKPMEKPPDAPSSDGSMASNAVVAVHDRREVEVPMALVMAVGITKKAALSVVAVLWDEGDSVESLKERSEAGKLIAASSTVTKVLRSLAEEDGPLSGVPFELEEADGKYRIVSSS